MGKNKLARWTELSTFSNVLQPEISGTPGKDHFIKGNWRDEIFRNSNPVVLELGCGKGEYTIALSRILPSRNFIGVDIKGARLWRGAKTSNENRISNAAFLRTRIEFIGSFFAADEIDEIWLTFPDPHPNRRNSNKRLVCPWFLNAYRAFLKDKGVIHLKTDNTELFDYTVKLAKAAGLEILFSTNDLHAYQEADKNTLVSFYSKLYGTGGNVAELEKILSIKTHYETIFIKGGLKIKYLAFRLEKEQFIHDAGERACR
ncbi:MAG: tRNA (guanosine(46)-N7)-methyltransferase TrmB [Bacteroidales bacterium]